MNNFSFICLIAQQAISQIEFVIRLKVKTGILRNKNEDDIIQVMKKRIRLIYVLLAFIVTSSVITSAVFIVHEN